MAIAIVLVFIFAYAHKQAHDTKSGEVKLVNEALEDAPELVNDDPYGKGWMIQIRIEDPTELEGLMTADAYREYLEDESREHEEE